MQLVKIIISINNQPNIYDTTCCFQVWGLIQTDLDWVVNNWGSDGCDLWEEVNSDNFYWNRMAYIYSLNKVADFADSIGEASAATTYRGVAAEIEGYISEHWNGAYLEESSGRPRDSAVLHAIATFGEYAYGPSSNEAAATLAELADTFCAEYPINQDGVSAGTPGLLFGR